MDDTHDKLMKKVLDYLAASEAFERRPSHPKKRTARRELRLLMQLAKERQAEISATYDKVLKELQENNKWQTYSKRKKDE